LVILGASIAFVLLVVGRIVDLQRYGPAPAFWVLGATAAGGIFAFWALAPALAARQKIWLPLVPLLLALAMVALTLRFG